MNFKPFEPSNDDATFALQSLDVEAVAAFLRATVENEKSIPYFMDVIPEFSTTTDAEQLQEELYAAAVVDYADWPAVSDQRTKKRKSPPVPGSPKNLLGSSLEAEYDGDSKTANKRQKRENTSAAALAQPLRFFQVQKNVHLEKTKDVPIPESPKTRLLNALSAIFSQKTQAAEQSVTIEEEVTEDREAHPSGEELPEIFDPRKPGAIRVYKPLGKSQFVVELVEIIDKDVLARLPAAEKPLFLAMKKIWPLPRQAEQRDIFVREMNTQKLCRHDNLMSLRYAKIYDDEMLLCMRVMDNDLSLFIEDYAGFPTESSYKLNLPRVVLGLAEGIDFLHSKLESTLVHCDIKPANILFRARYLDRDKYPGVFELTEVRLSDFGGAKMEHTSIQGGAVSCVNIHSKHYSAPEQKVNFYLSIDAKVNRLVDVYSFGIVLGELLMRRKHAVVPRSENALHMNNATWHVDHMPVLFTEQELMAVGIATPLLIGIYKRCTQVQPELRPSISDILLELKNNAAAAFFTVDLDSLKEQNLLPSLDISSSTMNKFVTGQLTSLTPAETFPVLKDSNGNVMTMEQVKQILQLAQQLRELK